jgi:DNA-binding IclR family transcriptional regulator
MNSTFSPVKSADRVLDILELLVDAGDGRTLSEIGDRLQIAPSSVHGLTRTLLARGYLSRAGKTGKFRLGARLVHLGVSAREQVLLQQLARPVLERLVAETHDTAVLVVLEHGDLVYVDEVVSDKRGFRTDPRFKVRRPLTCTSLGKALLATLVDGDARTVADALGLEAATAHSIVEVEALVTDLGRTRTRGYALDEQEAVPGVCCVGAPIRDHLGQPAGAIGISTIGEFFDPASSGPLIRSAAVEISRAAGWPGREASLFEPLGVAPHMFLPVSNGRTTT